jgi:hypothetical protein
VRGALDRAAATTQVALGLKVAAEQLTWPRHAQHRPG